MKAAAVPIVTIVVYPDISRFCCLLSLLSCLPAAVTLLAPWIRDTQKTIHVETNAFYWHFPDQTAAVKPIFMVRIMLKNTTS